MRAVILLVVVVGVTALLYWYLRGWLSERRAARPGAWRLEERSDGELLTLRAVRRGDEPLLLGSVAIAATDFDTRIYELRVEAQAKVDALNEGRALRR